VSRLSFPSLDKGGGSVLPVRNQIKIAWKKLKGLKRFDEFNDKLISAQIWSLQTPIYTPFFQCRKQYTVATSGHFPAEKNTCDLLFLVWSHTFQSSVLLWEFRTEIGLWDNVAFFGVRKRKCDFIWNHVIMRNTIKKAIWLHEKREKGKIWNNKIRSRNHKMEMYKL
jgi:hypothetical protein